MFKSSLLAGQESASGSDVLGITPEIIEVSSGEDGPSSPAAPSPDEYEEKLAEVIVDTSSPATSPPPVAPTHASSSSEASSVPALGLRLLQHVLTMAAKRRRKFKRGPALGKPSCRRSRQVSTLARLFRRPPSQADQRCPTCRAFIGKDLCVVDAGCRPPDSLAVCSTVLDADHQCSYSSPNRRQRCRSMQCRRTHRVLKFQWPRHSIHAYVHQLPDQACPINSTTRAVDAVISRRAPFDLRYFYIWRSLPIRSGTLVLAIARWELHHWVSQCAVRNMVRVMLRSSSLNSEVAKEILAA
ncbi:hypothetical protein GN958_ATG07830 [Phytophthora infestans]|nr:hypothetical protein GN958_ATG07830 [Phytophthora infestans]